MSKPPPDLGEDSARLYESPGQKTEEMAVQLFRVHYTSGERARVKQRLSPPRFAVARPERERRSASKTNFQLSRPSGRWFVGLRYAVREDLSAVAGMASVSNGALDSQVDFLGRRCLKKGPLLNTGRKPLNLFSYIVAESKLWLSPRPLRLDQSVPARLRDRSIPARLRREANAEAISAIAP
jgi:hypothetical protein